MRGSERKCGEMREEVGKGLRRGTGEGKDKNDKYTYGRKGWKRVEKEGRGLKKERWLEKGKRVLARGVLRKGEQWHLGERTVNEQKKIKKRRKNK